MLRVVAKNTFLSLVDDGSSMFEVTDMQILVKQAAPRSKSAEITRSRPFANTQNELSQYSVTRLNAMLSVGLPVSSRHPSSVYPINAIQGDRDDQVKQEPTLSNAHDFSELESLQDTIGKALAETAPPINERPVQKPLGAFKHFRNASICSVSTMAPDDASESGDVSRSNFGRMPYVCSSGSVDTMVSKIDDYISEAGEMQFELNIEEHSHAEVRRALPKETTPKGRGSKHSAVRDCSHNLVPRNRNLAEMYGNNWSQAAPTTLMIRNIPSRYSQQDLMMDLKDLGLAGTFDFLYIPMDTSTLASVGYGFVNFKDPAWAVKCMEVFEDFRFRRHSRGASKVATVSIAHMQGLEKNLQHYEKSAVSASRCTARRPLIMANIKN